jgi:hypothetical protein
VAVGILVAFLGAAQANDARVTGFAPYERTGTINGVSASIYVAVFPGGRSALSVEFTRTSNSPYPVGCLTAYHDLQYELRDEEGQLISVNSSALERPPSEAPHHMEHTISSNYVRGPVDCHTLATHKSERRADLQALYPHLRRGSYTLRITFAPREMTGASSVLNLIPIHVLADF